MAIRIRNTVARARLLNAIPRGRSSFSNVASVVDSTSAGGSPLGLLLVLTDAGSTTQTTAPGGFAPRARIKNT